MFPLLLTLTPRKMHKRIRQQHLRQHIYCHHVTYNTTINICVSSDGWQQLIIAASLGHGHWTVFPSRRHAESTTSLYVGCTSNVLRLCWNASSMPTTENSLHEHDYQHPFCMLGLHPWTALGDTRHPDLCFTSRRYWTSNHANADYV